MENKFRVIVGDNLREIVTMLNGMQVVKDNIVYITKEGEQYLCMYYL